MLAAALAGEPGVGTVFRARRARLPARKLWIAFALGASGSLTVDEGARLALTERGRSLLAAGVTGVAARFVPEDAVEIAGPDGAGLRQGPGPAARRPRAGGVDGPSAARSSSTATTWSCNLTR